MKKIIFLTFANTTYMKTDRIINEAKSFNIFDKILSKTEKDIPDFINKHKIFIKRNKPGYGFWIWKPKIILDNLMELNDNDILIYCDAGFHLNNKGIKRLEYYFSTLNNDKSFCVFSASDRYKAQSFVKNDAIMSYYPQFNNELNTCCYAGIMIIKKNNISINLINDWLKLCENYNFLDKSRSKKYKDLKHYKGNDCDNGLFNLCLSKYKKIVNIIYPDEINIYLNGIQYHHLNINERKKLNWSQLDDKPFQARRLTPKFGYN